MKTSNIQLFDLCKYIDAKISFYENLGRIGERDKFVSILNSFDINTELSPTENDFDHLTIWHKAKLYNNLCGEFKIRN